MQVSLPLKKHLDSKYPKTFRRNIHNNIIKARMQKLFRLHENDRYIMANPPIGVKATIWLLM